MISTKNGNGSSFVNSVIAESEKYPTTIHYGYELLKGCNIFHDLGKLEEIINNVERQIPKKEKYSKEEAIKILETAYREIENLGFKDTEDEFDCKSYSLIALAVGEKFNLPLYGVYAPKHIFVRYDPDEKSKEFKELEQPKKPSALKKLINFILPFSEEKNLYNKKEEVFNWEATDGSVEEDIHYKIQGNISEESIENGVYLRNLTKQELIGFFYYVNGGYNLMKGNLDLAIEDLNKAIKLDPLHSSAYAYRGKYNLEKEEFDLAAEDLNKSIELDSLDAGKYFLRGEVYFKKGNLDLAIEDFNKSIELDPSEPCLYYNRGTLHFKKGNLDLAIEDFNKSIELDPSEPEAYYHRGTLYFKKENFDSSIENLDKAIELDPLNPYAYCIRGCAYGNKGMLFRALEDFNRVLEINPSDVVALNHKNHTEQLLEQEKREFLKIFREKSPYVNKKSSLEKSYINYFGKSSLEKSLEKNYLNYF